MVAIDLSESMLRVARSALADRYSNIEFRHGDITRNLGIPKSCDVVFSVATLHWVGKHAVAFANIADAIKPGGRFLADCGGKGNISSIYEAVQSVLGPSEADGLFHFEDVSSTEKRLVAAGFKVNEVCLVSEPAEFDSPETFRSFIATMILGAHLAEVDSGEKNALLSRIIDRLPGMVVDYVRLRIDAVKL